MSTALITVIILSFIALLVLNVIFRVKVFKAYKKLVQNEVEFDSKHMFDARLLEEEILPKYPQHKDDIVGMIGNMKRSLNISLMLIALILVAGFILKRTQ